MAITNSSTWTVHIPNNKNKVSHHDTYVHELIMWYDGKVNHVKYLPPNAQMHTC